MTRPFFRAASCALAFCLAPLPAIGADWYVDASAPPGGDGSEANPWDKIDTASQIAQSGDTIWIKGGPVSYQEQIHPPPRVGITYEGYGSTLPVLVPFECQSGCVPDCVLIQAGSDNTTVKKIRCDGGPLGGSPDFRLYALLQSQGNVIEDCEFVGGNGWHGIAIQSDRNRLLGNVIWPNPPIDGDPYACVEPLDSCGATSVVVQGQQNLIEGNTVLDGGHDALQIQSSFNLIRGNTFTNPNWRAVGITPVGNPPTDLAEYNVFEGNGVTANLNTTYTGIQNAFQLHSRRNIVRRNRFYDNTGNGLRIGGNTNYDINDNRIYHNVFYENGQWGNYTAGFGLGIGGGPRTGNLLLNNILLHNNDDDQGFPGDGPPGVQLQFVGNETTALSGTFIRDNDILYVNPGDAVIEVIDTTPPAPACEGGGSAPTAASSLAAFETCYPSLISNNLEVDPQFVNPALGAFQIVSTSPMRNSGGFLAQTTSAASGTVIPVNDASGFFDGFGITGVTGDRIRLGGTNTRRTIIAVNYATNQLTVDSSLSWTLGQGVHTDYAESLPDIGAYEFVPGGCGLGWELILILPLLAILVRWRGREYSGASPAAS